MNLSDLVTAFSRYVHRISDVDVCQQITKAATNNIAMTACSAQAISTFCYYLVSIDRNGNVTVTKGTDNTYALPSTPAGNIPIGSILVNTDGTHTFTSGTDDLSGAGITAVCYDIDTGIAQYLINQAMQRLERGVTIVRNNRQRMIMDFDHMLVRAQETIVQGDSTITLPFPNYKDFQDNGIKITDSSSVTYDMAKRDFLPTGVVFQSRPVYISRNPPIETVFTKDGYPAREFDIWPEADQPYTIDTIAYQYSPPLDGVIYATNWLTENASDVLLFGALVESVSYFLDDPRIPTWQDRWTDAVWILSESQKKERVSGTMISTKFPLPLNQRAGLGLSSNKAGIYSFGFIGDN